MVAKFNGKGPDIKKGGANKPAGLLVQPIVKEVKTPASEAKKRGGSASVGSGIGNT
jgi:hypothetical protein